MLKSCALILILAVSLPSSADLVGQTSKTKTSKSLYDRLGGQLGLMKVVIDFVGACEADSRISPFFAATVKSSQRQSTFKANIFQQICALSGGPCKYESKDMKAAHAGMGITNLHFNAFIENLTKSLEKFKVAAADQEELLNLLAPMRADIVEKKSGPHDGPS